MSGVGNLIARIWANICGRSGTCENCGRVLRDDQVGFCSEECSLEREQKMAW
jgi:predicted nucleic acid-binding Zn ribbon protein